MFCTRCGLQLEEKDRYCFECGAATGRGPSPLAPKRLMRSRTGTKLAGVCAGLAEYLDADPVIIRVIWVILTLGLPPAGVLGYIAAWMIMPREAIPVAQSPVSITQY